MKLDKVSIKRIARASIKTECDDKRLYAEVTQTGTEYYEVEVTFDGKYPTAEAVIYVTQPEGKNAECLLTPVMKGAQLPTPYEALRTARVLEIAARIAIRLQREGRQR